MSRQHGPRPADEAQRPAGTARRLWALLESAAVEGHPSGVVVLAPWGETDLGAAGLRVEYLLRRMSEGPVSLDNARSGADRALLGRLLENLSGLVVHCLAVGERARPVLCVRPVCHPALFVPAEPSPYDVVRISRWATIRPEAGALVVSAPQARHEVVCEGVEIGELLLRLTTPRQVSDLVGIDPRGIGGNGTPDRVPASPAPSGESADLLAALGFLLGAGVLVRRGPEGRFAEDGDPDLRRWSPHELEFEVRARRESLRPAEPDPAAPDEARPAAGSPDAGPAAPLPAPVPGADPHPLDVLHARDGDAVPVRDGRVDRRGLGELFARGLRRGPVAPQPRDPAGDGIEVYVAVARADDLARGVYHVVAGPDGHGLRPLRAFDTLVDDVTGGVTGPDAPAAVLLITERRAEPSSAAGGQAAALARAGALQQTLTLAAAGGPLAVRGLPLTAAESWQRLVATLWPAETPTGVCRIDVVGR